MLVYALLIQLPDTSVVIALNEESPSYSLHSSQTGYVLVLFGSYSTPQMIFSGHFSWRKLSLAKYDEICGYVDMYTQKSTLKQTLKKL